MRASTRAGMPAPWLRIPHRAVGALLCECNTPALIRSSPPSSSAEMLMLWPCTRGSGSIRMSDLRMRRRSSLQEPGRPLPASWPWPDSHHHAREASSGESSNCERPGQNSSSRHGSWNRPRALGLVPQKACALLRSSLCGAQRDADGVESHVERDCHAALVPCGLDEEVPALDSRHQIDGEFLSICVSGRSSPESCMRSSPRRNQCCQTLNPRWRFSRAVSDRPAISLASDPIGQP